jgi:hypothetical protein
VWEPSPNILGGPVAPKTAPSGAVPTTIYFGGRWRRSLGIVAQIKIMGEHSLVFIGLWFGSIRLPSEKYKIMSRKKKEFEDLENLVNFFRLYFIIAGTAYCISTMY